MILHNVMGNHEYYHFCENVSPRVEKMGPLTKRLTERLFRRKFYTH